MIVYAKRPSAAAFVARAIAPRPGWARRQGFPDLRLEWRGYALDAAEVQGLLALADAAQLAPAAIQLLAPHVTGFALTMAVLTQPSWPLPISSALQVRNRLLLYQTIEPDRRYNLVTRTGAWRVLERGIEVDLVTGLQDGARTLWESIVTFYYRGRFAPASGFGEPRGAAPVSPKLDAHARETDRWHVEPAGKWAFAKLTGDFNPLHQWDAYARRLGFRAASAHPQRVAARCLQQLPVHSGAQQLDLWIKGPVYFGSEVVHRQVHSAACGACEFGVWMREEPRPALVGSWSALP